MIPTSLWKLTLETHDDEMPLRPRGALRRRRPRARRRKMHQRAKVQMAARPPWSPSCKRTASASVIKVEGGCYEVYATDKAGKRANMAFNAETLEKLDNAEAGEN